MIYLFGMLAFSVTNSIPTALRLFTDVRGALHRIEMFLKTTEYSREELSPQVGDVANELKLLQTRTTSSSNRCQLPFLNLHEVNLSTSFQYV